MEKSIPAGRRPSPEEQAARRIVPVTEHGIRPRVVGVVPSFIQPSDSFRPMRPGCLDYRKIPSLMAGVRVMPGDMRKNWSASPALRYHEPKGAGLGYYPSKSLKRKAQEAREGASA